MAFARIARVSLSRAIGNHVSEKDLILRRVVSNSCRLHSSENAQTLSANFFLHSDPGHTSKLGHSISQVKGIRTSPHFQFPSAAGAREQPDTEDEMQKFPGLEATKSGEKPRVVVLGTGWAACRFLKGLDARIYDVVCISPRNHMVFTPLLASTCVGTLEFRSVAEPVGRIQPALSTNPNSYFFLASCTGIDTDKHEVNNAFHS